jgi:hypothetical protein
MHDDTVEVRHVIPRVQSIEGIGGRQRIVRTVDVRIAVELSTGRPKFLVCVAMLLVSDSKAAR